VKELVIITAKVVLVICLYELFKALFDLIAMEIKGRWQMHRDRKKESRK
jgi:hypothetical protein